MNLVGDFYSYSYATFYLLQVDGEERENGVSFSDDDAEQNSDDMWGGDDDDQELEVERKSRKLEAKRLQVAADSAAEFMSGVQDEGEEEEGAQSHNGLLPLVEEGEKEEEEDGIAMDLEAVHTRIQEIARVLNDFTNLRDPNRSRQVPELSLLLFVIFLCYFSVGLMIHFFVQDYVDQLTKDISVYYGYSLWMTVKIMALFSVSEV